MAGKPGRSGGARPGSGPKKKAPVAPSEAPAAPPVVVDPETDPLAFLLGVMRGSIEANPLQVRSAIAAAQYLHTKKADGGKKDEQADAAKKAGTGKFSPKQPPRLVANNG